MAQIKKLQPGGKTPEKTTPKYGRLIQNGKSYQANDDMINWLAQQGHYGEQMANNLRNGDDQYLDTNEQGVGIIRNISVENPELKEKQRKRITRASRRLEGKRLNLARADIQRLSANYDYSTFAETPKAKTPYKWDTLVIDYNPKEDGTKEFSNNQVNFDIIQRLKDLKNGLVIPEDQEFKDYDRVVQHYNNIKDLLGDLEKDGKEGVISRMYAGKLTADDEDILAGLGILATAPKKETATKEELEKAKTEAITKGVKNWLNTNLKLNGSDLSTHSSYWTTNDSNELVATDELYKLIGGNKNYWFGPESPYKGYVLLNGKLTPTNLVDEKGNQTAFGKWWESSDGQEFRNKYRAGLWSDAAEHMAFDGSDQTWNYVDPYTQISQYLDPGTVYRDVSHHYDFKPEYADKYIGVITKMNDPVDGELLPSYKDYAIKDYGELVDISIIGEDYTRPVRPSSRPTKLNVYTLNPNGNFREFTYQYIDNSGKTHDIIVTLDQSGRVVKLTEDGKDYNILDQKDFQNNRTDIWNTIKKYLDRKTGPKARKMDYDRAIKEKQDQGIDSFQPGGKLKSSTENKTYIQQVGAITDPTKSYSTKDFKEGFEMNDYDKAELAGLIADGVGLLASFVPGWNVAAAGLGAVSSGANFYASLRDGFQLSDVLYGAGDLAMTLGTLVPGVGTSASLAKLTKGVVKAHKFLAPLFIGYGLYDGYDGLTKMLSGDFNIQDARAVANGLMALRGIVGNKKSHRTTRKYGVELDSDGKPRKPKVTTKENPLDTFLDNNKGDKKIEKLKKEIVDNLVKDNPNLKTLEDGTPVEWVDKDMKISDYEKAWEGLRKKSDHITDEMIIDNRTWQQGLGMNYQKAKQVVSDSTEKGTNWFKQYIGELVVPADPTKYGLNPELDAADLKAAKKNYTVRSFMDSSPETWVLSNKKGGKIRKCQDGDELWDPELEEREESVLDMESTDSSLNLSQKLPKLPWMTPIKEKIEFKPSGTIPAKKGAIDQVLEPIRQSFQNGMNNSSKEFSKTQSKYISLGSNKNDGYGKNPNTGLGQTIFDGVMNGMGRGVAFLNTEFTNRQVLDTSLKGIRGKYLGAMKRMPVGQYYDRYSFMPIISTFDDQKTEARIASNQIVKGLSDQKMQLAQNNMTENRIAKGEQNLLDQISKHITEKDLANIQRKNQFAKDEQAIAEYNQQLGGQQLAEEAGAWAQFYQKQGDNRNKLIAEFRTDNEKYQSAMDTNNAYKKLQNLYSAYDSETDPNKKLKLKERISLLSYLIKNGANARNPITGQSALNV